ncbi:MAG: hypothetical protein LPK45_04305 [Bacteroidota bacterium]|nr:hypothetical protein [Bacteroidota bacterium]MDX5430276.1 hypothetical protein [Bacteroidota bacterium]MDX5469037.1 hypothetical protein [Bacteroidota bacterium]
MLRSTCQKILIACLILSPSTLLSQELEALIRLNDSAEMQVVSGEVQIQTILYSKNSPTDSSAKKLRFYKEPGAESALFTLDDEFGGTYFPVHNTVAYWLDGLQYVDPISGYRSPYYWEFSLTKEILRLNLVPKVSTRSWLLEQYLQYEGKEGEEFLYDPLKREFQFIRTVEYGINGNYFQTIHQIRMNENWLPAEYVLSNAYSLPDTQFVRKEKQVFYRYSRINQVPYFEVKKDVEQNGRAPIVKLVQPAEMAIASHPEKGQPFPDLYLTDLKGNSSQLSDAKKKKLLVYYSVEGFDPKDVFHFVDSIKSHHPELDIYLLTHSTKVLEFRKNLPLELRTNHYACSKVNGLDLNGFPVWFLVDEKNILIAESHGFQIQFASNITDWLNSHLKQP